VVGARPLRVRVHAVVKCAILSTTVSTTVISHKWHTVMVSPTLKNIRSEALNLSELEREEAWT